MTKDKMTVAFSRVSSDQQDTKAQELAINNYCKENNIVINKWVKEEGVSGFKTSLENREGLQEIKELCLDGKVKRLIIFNSDRLGRRLETIGFLTMLDECNVEVISVTEGILNSGLDTDSLINSIKFWTAQYESKKIGERVKNGKKANWKDDAYVGGKLSLGYKIQDKKVVLDEKYVPIIKNIFDLYIKHGTVECVRYLDKLGLKNERGKPYTRQSILGIIKNKNYLGYRNSNVYGENFQVESLRIIDDYTFRKANELLKSRTVCKDKIALTDRTDNKYEGLIYHDCYDGTVNKMYTSYVYAGGKRYHTLLCSHCKSYRYPIKVSYATKKLFKELDNAIEDRLASLSSDKIEWELRQKKECTIRALETEIELHEDLLKEDNKLLEGLNKTLDDIFKGKLKFDLQQMLDRVGETQNRIIEKEKTIKQLKDILEVEKNKEENKHKLLDKFKNFKHIYDIGDSNQKKMVLRELIDKIIIDKHKNIRIILKYIED